MFKYFIKLQEWSTSLTEVIEEPFTFFNDLEINDKIITGQNKDIKRKISELLNKLKQKFIDKE